MTALTSGAPRAAMPKAVLEARLAEYREPVRRIILDAIPKHEPQRHLYELVAAQLSNEGKGLRPALCLATCRAFGGDERRALPSAGALELLHNAFLVHDDIEDESEYRRGQPTLHQRYGTPLALNAGDAMNALSARLLAKNLGQLGPEQSAQLFREFDHLSLETIEGQAMELGWIRDNDCATSEEDYLTMVLKKTSWYSFIHPARIGALLAEPHDSNLDRFNAFGYFLGAAFQIQDDLLNLTGDRRKYGKEIGGDLLEGKRTLILTHLFGQCDASERERLRSFLAKPRAERLPREVTWLQSLVRSRGSLEYARRAAAELAGAARRAFEVAYADALPGPDLDFLYTLVDYMVTRDS